MKRRSFLKSAAAFFPAAGLEAFSHGQAPASSSSDQLHVVLSGEDRLGESHSRGYSSILFKVLSRETRNGMFVIEHFNLIEGGPPLHIHLLQEEYFYVVEGEVSFRLETRASASGPATPFSDRAAFRMPLRASARSPGEC
jgi:hypothetical protein